MSLDDLRRRLELARGDARERRLDGLIEHYAALREFEPDWNPATVTEAFREFGEALDRSGYPHLAVIAAETSRLIERWMEEGLWTEPWMAEPSEREGSGIAAGD